MRVGQGVYAQTSNKRCSDWVCWCGGSWSAGGWKQSRRAAAQERKVLEGDRKAQLTAPAQQGPQQKQLNMAGRTPAGSREDAPTSCPGIRQAHTAQTQPFVTSISKPWQERQALCSTNTQSRTFGETQKKVGRNGIMAKDHKGMAWSSLTTSACSGSPWSEAVLQPLQHKASATPLHITGGLWRAVLGT